MAGTGVGKFSSTAGNNTSNMTVNFAENMAPSNVNNAARELMGHIYDMYKQLGDGYFEFGDGDATYTVARSDADTITITSSSDISSIYFPGRKIRITDGGANVVEGTIASSSHTSTTQTVNLTGISLASGTPTKVELGIDTAAFGGRIILDDDGDSYIEAPTDDTIDFYAGGTKIGTFTATTVGFNDGVTVTTNDTSDTLTLLSGDTGSSAAPNLLFNRNSGSPAANDFLGSIDFQGKNSAGDDHNYIRILSRILSPTDGSETADLVFKDALGNNILNMAASEIVFNDDSVDRDFRVESNGNTHMLFVDGGNNAVGIGTSTIDAQVHIMKNDAGALLDANADNLFIEDTSATGITIGSSNSGEGHIRFSDSDDADVCSISYFHADDSLRFRVNTSDRFRISDGGKIMIGGETAPDVSDGGLCIDQNTGDSNAFTLKSSDVAHGVTDLDETDTWFSLRKFGANDGGVQLRSLSGASSNVGLWVDTVAGSEDTGKGTGDHGCTNIDAQKDSGTDKAPLAANGNLLTVSNDGAVRFILDAEGDIHVDGSSSISTYDTYEDAQLVRAYDLSYGQTSKGLINSKFDKFINYNHDSLIEAGIIGVPDKKENEDGTESYGLLNSTAMQRLHNGAIWQQYEKHQRLASAFYKLAEKTIGKEEADKLLTDEEIQLLN